MCWNTEKSLHGGRSVNLLLFTSSNEWVSVAKSASNSEREKRFSRSNCNGWLKLDASLHSWSENDVLEWKHCTSPVRKMFKFTSYAVKVMLTVVYNSKGVLVEFLELRGTVNSWSLLCDFTTSQHVTSALDFLPEVSSSLTTTLDRILQTKLNAKLHGFSTSALNIHSS